MGRIDAMLHGYNSEGAAQELLKDLKTPEPVPPKRFPDVRAGVTFLMHGIFRRYPGEGMINAFYFV